MQNHTPASNRSMPRPRLRTLAAGLLAFLAALLATSGLVALAGPHPEGAGLEAVGPIASDHVFPVWYRDTSGTRLELCLDVDTYCLLTSADLPRPGQPVDFSSGNFPGEAFWMAADSFLVVPGAVDASLVLALEGAFLNELPVEGDQVIFGRVRIRVSGLQASQTYTVTHPYGKDTFVAEGGAINFTEDIGLDKTGVGALNSRIGPFLRWDPAVAPAAPAGFIGDPAVEHQVTGSPYSTNYFMVEGPGVRAAGGPNACPGRPLDTACAYTNLFILAGKYATNAGVEINAARYSRGADGSTTLDVFARSEASRAIEVDGSNFLKTAAQADGGNYYARITHSGAPATITVINQSDSPPASKTATPTDMVTVSQAQFNVDTRELRIAAGSSDLFSGPTLTVEEYGLALVNGGLVIPNLDAPPMSITVRSSAGGHNTAQVQIVGSSMAPIALVANPGAGQTVVQGATVRLDGSQSLGEVEAWKWEQSGGPTVALSGAATAQASFTAPNNPGETLIELSFRLSVSNAVDSDSALVTVKVLPGSTPPVAQAGADQSVVRGTLVQLDGTATTNATSYAWAQLSGPPVTLSGASTARPSFTYPQSAENVVLQLTATGPGGSSSDSVQISPLTDGVTITLAQYTRSSGEWRVRGTALIAGQGNQAYIYRGSTCPVGGTPTNSNLLAITPVDALGSWEYRGSGPVATTGQRVSVCTLGGARQLNFAVRIR